MTMNLSLTLAQATNLVATCGMNTTTLLRGQPGIGKSSILRSLARSMPDYLPCYVDVANLDLGDLAMPVVDRETMTTSYAPNARFGVSPKQKRPVLLMLDELGKASRPVLNMLLPVILERRLGDLDLPEGSIVFATTNLDTDGVGDNIPAHAYNRMTVCNISNPTADEWLQWAGAHDIAPEVMAFAKQYPNVFDSYADLVDGEANPYIFDPRKGQVRSFCSPRSLEKASNLIANRAVLGDALLPALAGTIGEAAARDMEALVHLADQIPTLEAIVADPDQCKLPSGVGAYFVMSFMLAGRINAENIDAVMTYVKRWEQFEASALFTTTLAGNAAKFELAYRNRAFTEMCTKYGKFY